MTETTSQPIPEHSKRGLFQQLELDVRLLGMIGAFVILCIGFNILTDGRFLTPRNIFNLTIQTVSVAIMTRAQRGSAVAAVLLGVAGVSNSERAAIQKGEYGCDGGVFVAHSAGQPVADPAAQRR